MTIQNLKSQIGDIRQAIEQGTWVLTTLTPYPLRLVAVGRSTVSVLNNAGDVRRVDPIVITGVHK